MLKDRVQETSTTTGTGDLTLSNLNAAGYVSFSTAFSTGVANLFYYVITQDAAWEAGIGYMSAATTMVRNTVLASSNANALVNFPAGTKYVFNTAPADRYTDWREQLLKRPAVQYYTEVINNIGAGNGARTIDLSLGNVVVGTNTGNTTFTFTNVPTTANRAFSFTFILTAGGGAPTNWPASVKWSYGIAAPLHSSGVDILTFFTVNNGTTWHGMLASSDSK